MRERTAREALEYATDGELLKLYGVILVGRFLTVASGATVLSGRPGVFDLLNGIVSTVLFVAGFLLVAIGVVAVARTLLDGRA